MILVCEKITSLDSVVTFLRYFISRTSLFRLCSLLGKTSFFLVEFFVDLIFQTFYQYEFIVQLIEVDSFPWVMMKFACVASNVLVHLLTMIISFSLICSQIWNNNWLMGRHRIFLYQSSCILHHCSFVNMHEIKNYRCYVEHNWFYHMLMKKSHHQKKSSCCCAFHSIYSMFALTDFWSNVERRKKTTDSLILIIYFFLL